MSRVGNRLVRWALPLLCLLAACAGTRFQGQNWKHVETRHFAIASSASSARTLEIARKLERFHAAALGLFERPDPASLLPTRTYVFADHASFALFRPSENLAGFFFQSPARNYIVVDASNEAASLITAYHEYVHHLLRNLGTSSDPTWYQEGLAELMSSLEFAADGETLVLGRIPPLRVPALRLGTPLGLEQLLGTLGTRAMPGRSANMFYAESWALTHFFHLGSVLNYPDRYAQMLVYLKLVRSGVEPAPAVQRAFGVGIPELEQEFLRYVQEGKFGTRVMPAPRFTLQAAPVVSLARAEQLYLLADLALALRGQRAPDPEPLLRRAVEDDPQHARALAALGLLLVRRADPAGDALLERASALAGDEASVQLALGESLALRAVQAAPEARATLRAQARVALQRTLALDPANAEAAIALTRQYFDAGDADLGAAVAALETVREHRPDYDAIDVLLAQLYLRRGEMERARQLLARVIEQPHSGVLATPEQTAQLEGLLAQCGFAASSPDTGMGPALDWFEPRAQARIEGLVPLVPVRGRAGLGDDLRHDVVVLLDQSSSTTKVVGVDVNEDGVANKSDTVLEAELAAVRGLLQRLDPETTRVALLTFAEESVQRTPLGPPQASLDYLAGHALSGNGRTSFAAALAGALQPFLEGIDVGTRRQRSIIMFSDGVPTDAHVSPLVKRGPLVVVDRLIPYGIRVNTFALGLAAVNESAVYREIAERTGGRYRPVADIARTGSELLELRLSSLQTVHLRNQTSGEDGRAVRLFPDGSFDGYLPLVLGKNELEVTITVEDGRQRSEVRTVYYARPAQPTPADETRAARLLEELRLRSLELDLQPGQQRPPDRSRDLEIRPQEESLPAP